MSICHFDFLNFLKPALNMVSGQLAVDRVTSCIRIRTRGRIYGKIWPELEGNPKESGLILPT